MMCVTVFLFYFPERLYDNLEASNCRVIYFYYNFVSSLLKKKSKITTRWKTTQRIIIKPATFCVRPQDFGTVLTLWYFFSYDREQIQSHSKLNELQKGSASAVSGIHKMTCQ